MLCGVTVMLHDLPREMAREERLHRRIYQMRGGPEEVRFFWWEVEQLLPVWFEGQLRLVQWGNKNRRSRLPYTCCTRRTTIEAGIWQHLEPEQVRIVASFALDKGCWYDIVEGIEGIVVRDERGSPVVYVVCEPATEYYRMMTRSDWAPALVNQVI